MQAQRTWHTCMQCGRRFERVAARIRGRPFCSVACYRIAGPLRGSTAERLWSKVCKTDCCWLWFGATRPDGYGKMMRGHQRTVLAHRVSYEVACGPIPDDKIITHTCDVKQCVRPEHLQLGTKSSNLLERYERKDVPPCCGGPVIWF